MHTCISYITSRGIDSALLRLEGFIELCFYTSICPYYYVGINELEKGGPEIIR